MTHFTPIHLKVMSVRDSIILTKTNDNIIHIILIAMKNHKILTSFFLEIDPSDGLVEDKNT